MKTHKLVFHCILFFIFFVLLLSGASFFCFAETVYLKNGRKVEGMIKELDDASLVIEVAGVSLGYDLKDVKRLDILDKGETQKDVSDFIEAINLMISDDLRDEAQKEAEVMDLRLEDKPWHGYLVSEEARDLIARHRRQMQLIQEPSLCVYLKKLYLNWMLLRENKHNAFCHGDWNEAEKLKGQIAEYVDKINAELERIRWLCGDEHVRQIQEDICARGEEPQENQAQQDRRQPKPAKKDVMEEKQSFV